MPVVLGCGGTVTPPIYGRRLTVPAHVRIPDRLVHLVMPLFFTHTGQFSGRYSTCLGVLDNTLIISTLSDTPIDWETWVVPDSTPLTCLTCLVADTGRRGPL